MLFWKGKNQGHVLLQHDKSRRHGGAASVTYPIAARSTRQILILRNPFFPKLRKTLYVALETSKNLFKPSERRRMSSMGMVESSDVLEKFTVANVENLETRSKRRKNS